MTGYPGSADDYVRTSYRALRLSIVVVVLALMVSLVIERARASCLQGSISSYYYTPVHSVFVGGLMAMGLVMVALKGRDIIEDQLFNIAGILAPIVALVPTSRPTGPDGTSAGICSRPDEVLDISARGLIINNVPALAAAVAIALAITIVIARRQHRDMDAASIPKATRAGITISVVLLVAGLAWFVLWTDSFYRRAHGGAAIAMFVFIWLAVLVNTGWPSRLWSWVYRSLGAPEPGPPTSDAARARRLRYRRWYRGIAVAMPAVAVCSLLLPGDVRIFWLEVGQIVPFALFWLVQTFDGWDTGVAPPAAAV